MHCTVSFATGKQRRFLTQSQAITSFPGLRSDYERLVVGLGIVETVDAVLQDEVEDGMYFPLALGAIRSVESHKSPLGVGAWFHLKLMEMEGVLPDWQSANVSEQVQSAPLGRFFGHASSGDLDRKLLITLERLAELDKPAENVKMDVGAFAATTAWWEAVLHRRLDACRAVLGAKSLQV